MVRGKQPQPHQAQDHRNTSYSHPFSPISPLPASLVNHPRSESDLRHDRQSLNKSPGRPGRIKIGNIRGRSYPFVVTTRGALSRHVTTFIPSVWIRVHPWLKNRGASRKRLRPYVVLHGPRPAAAATPSSRPWLLILLSPVSRPSRLRCYTSRSDFAARHDFHLIRVNPCASVVKTAERFRKAFGPAAAGISLGIRPPDRPARGARWGRGRGP